MLGYTIKLDAKIAKFIKQNSILAYNTDFEEYLDIIIHEEEQKRQRSNQAVLDCLRNMNEKIRRNEDWCRNRTTRHQLEQHLNRQNQLG